MITIDDYFSFGNEYFVFVLYLMTTSANFAKLLSFIVANVHDPTPKNVQSPAYRMQCWSCASSYLENQYNYVSHLYRKPLTFTEKCDQNNFDENYMRTKNCTDLCVTLRLNDKVGGRRKRGYLRGCISDIVHYNRSAIKEIPTCYTVRLKELFVNSDRYGLDPLDHVELCTCHKPLCNRTSSNSIWQYQKVYFLFWVFMKFYVF